MRLSQGIGICPGLRGHQLRGRCRPDPAAIKGPKDQAIGKKWAPTVAITAIMRVRSSQATICGSTRRKTSISPASDPHKTAGALQALAGRAAGPPIEAAIMARMPMTKPAISEGPPKRHGVSVPAMMGAANRRRGSPAARRHGRCSFMHASFPAAACVRSRR